MRNPWNPFPCGWSSVVEASFKQGMHSHFATIASTSCPNTLYCSGSELISQKICISHQVPAESGAAGPWTTLGELLPDLGHRDRQSVAIYHQAYTLVSLLRGTFSAFNATSLGLVEQDATANKNIAHIAIWIQTVKWNPSDENSNSNYPNKQLFKVSF